MSSDLIQTIPRVHDLRTGDFSRDFLEEMSKGQDEPKWMREKRLAAFDLYETLLMPHTSDDDEWRRTVDMRTQDYWRRTKRKMRGFKLDEYKPVAFSASGSSEMSDRSGCLPKQVESEEAASGAVGLQDGLPVESFLLKELERKGVYFADFNTALRARPDFVRSYFMTNAVTLETQLRSGNIPLRNKFDALHGAFWQGGYLLHVPKGVVVEIPLRAFIALSEPQRADLSHTLIVADAESKVTILEEQASTDVNAAGFHCGAVEIFAGRNANVTYVQVQRWNQRVWNFSTQRAVVGRDAQFCWVTGMLGSRLSKLNQVAAMEGAGSRVEMLGLTFTHGRQHIDVSTAQEHIAPHTSSDLLYRTVLRDRSQTAWSGNIYVYPEGQHTDAYQKNDNLVLSERSHADTLPGLEIQAHEVRCTHGATAGPIDKEQVFYLMSRGLSRSQAEKMIVDGFFEPVMARIPLESVREELQESITHKLAVE